MTVGELIVMIEGRPEHRGFAWMLDFLRTLPGTLAAADHRERDLELRGVEFHVGTATRGVAIIVS